MKLTAAGYTVHEEVDGEAGLAAVQQVDPTVVILDWMMPRMNGLEVLQRIRSDESTRDLPVLLLTARAQEDAIESWLRRRRRRLCGQAVQSPRNCCRGSTRFDSAPDEEWPPRTTPPHEQCRRDPVDRARCTTGNAARRGGRYRLPSFLDQAQDVAASRDGRGDPTPTDRHVARGRPRSVTVRGRTGSSQQHDRRTGRDAHRQTTGLRPGATRAPPRPPRDLGRGPPATLQPAGAGAGSRCSAARIHRCAGGTPPRSRHRSRTAIARCGRSQPAPSDVWAIRPPSARCWRS